ncbi:hypothetical protein Q1695_006809 [Nippostrongylus brasiliensis]|nr:hypothetical protein Q1695_006809 [Nippostrongylus brasiliensis]
MEYFSRIFYITLYLRDVVSEQLDQCEEPCRKMKNDVPSSTNSKLSEYVRSSLNYKVDPCDNFYQFACGNWKSNAPPPESLYDETSSLYLHMDRYTEQKRAAIMTEKVFTSKAITQARVFYSNCFHAEEDWRSRNTSGIHYLTEKINTLGVFPMISHDQAKTDEFLRNMDHTTLLSYFNRNRTIVRHLVPTVVEDINALKAPTLTIKLITSDVGVEFKSTQAAADIKKLINFMRSLYSIPKITMDDYAYLRNVTSFDSKLRVKLSDVDRMVTKINYTKYLLEITPVEVHDVIKSDPPAKIHSFSYTKKLNRLLKRTGKRTFANFVITFYILHHVPMLDKRYRDLLKDFMKKLNVPSLVDRRKICFDIANKYFPLPILAMHVRLNFENVSKEIVGDLTSRLKDAFVEEITNNPWMDKEFKAAAANKIDKISEKLLYDDIAFDDNLLDNEYTKEIAVEHAPFLQMLDKFDHINQEKMFVKLVKPVNEVELASNIYYYDQAGANAYFFQNGNALIIPLSMAHFPFYDDNFPRSYLFGSFGFIVGHEISHSIDSVGIYFNEKGETVPWVKPEWYQQFNNRTSCFIRQYDGELIPPLNQRLDGQRTLSENIADTEGLKITYKAYKTYQKEHGEEARIKNIEDFSNDQLFFIAFALVRSRTL